MVLYGIVWYWMVLYGIVLYCMVWIYVYICILFVLSSMPVLNLHWCGCFRIFLSCLYEICTGRAHVWVPWMRWEEVPLVAELMSYQCGCEQSPYLSLLGNLGEDTRDFLDVPATPATALPSWQSLRRKMPQLEFDIFDVPSHVGCFRWKQGLFHD